KAVMVDIASHPVVTVNAVEEAVSLLLIEERPGVTAEFAAWAGQAPAPTKNRWARWPPLPALRHHLKPTTPTATLPAMPPPPHSPASTATVMTLRVSAACEDGRKSCCNDEFFH